MLLLTGVTGFVGRAFIEAYSQDLRKVIKGPNSNSKQEDFFYVSDINGRTDWSGAFESVDVIVHLAGIAHNKALSDSDFFETNFEGTKRLAQSAVDAGVKRFVFVSSIGVNGTQTNNARFSPYDRENPTNNYTKSKYEAEKYLHDIAEKTGMEIVIVRPTLVYGNKAPGNFSRLLKLVFNFSILPFGLSNNRRDFVSVQNLVDLLITCSTHPAAPGNIFLASDGETVSIKEFTNAVAEGLGKKIYQLPVPVGLIKMFGKLIGKSDIVEQLFCDLEVDSSNIYEVLGWTPPLTMKQSMRFLRYSGE